MSTYLGVFRSSYFKVKDLEKFKAFIASVPTEDGIRVRTSERLPGAVAIDAYDAIPTSYGEDGDADFLVDLAYHLEEGEIAVLEEAGHEKLRCVYGAAIAVFWDGRRCRLSLGDLAEKVLRETGVDITAVSDAQF